MGPAIWVQLGGAQTALLCRDRATPGEMVSDNKVTVKGLTEGKPYEFRVAAVNEAGPGQYAETKEAIKPAPAPSQSQRLLF